MMGSGMGAYGGAVRPVESAAGKTMLLWGLGQPEAHRNNALVRQAAHAFELDACGRRLSLLQSPSSMTTPGVTRAVVWDSGVVLAKFLEHAVDSQRLLLRGTRAVDLGSGCGLVGCAAALLGAHVVLTDLPDRLKLLRKNVALNVDDPHVPGSARVTELVWGDDPHHELLKDPLPDFVLGSDVIYNEEAVDDLLATLNQLSGKHTTILLAGELRNFPVLLPQVWPAAASPANTGIGAVDPRPPRVLEDLPPAHPHFTRLQRTRGAMDPVVRQMFDDLIHCFDAFRSEFDGLGARLDRRFTETEAVRSEHDSTVDSHLDSLEQFASAQYTATIVADNWGGHFSERISELEERVHDLEMVRYVEIQDERDERVTALESAAEAFEAWRPRIESSLFTVRSEQPPIHEHTISAAGEMSRGGATGMGGERSMGGKGAHLGDLGWPAGRGSSRGRAGRRRRVDDEQDRWHASRDEQGRSRTGGEEVVRRDGPRPARRTGGGDDQILRGDERMAPHSLLILPLLGLVAARRPGRAGIPPALRFGAPKLASLELALISRAYTPPSAAMRDYAPSRGDGLRPATRRT
ncbi:unnamed protein product [Miscanthus lutarioriparius]|uniref:Uncharacterized protein n=1 Tax=Miscanthus lutarioriparius TaxID=422564 RepID=A0A811RNJ4_9POAL|nr:unnamed protein product [Miscanthus lutarioriparius]